MEWLLRLQPTQRLSPMPCLLGSFSDRMARACSAAAIANLQHMLSGFGGIGFVAKGLVRLFSGDGTIIFLSSSCRFQPVHASSRCFPPQIPFRFFLVPASSRQLPPGVCAQPGIRAIFRVVSDTQGVTGTWGETLRCTRRNSKTGREQQRHGISRFKGVLFRQGAMYGTQAGLSDISMQSCKHHALCADIRKRENHITQGRCNQNHRNLCIGVQ